MNLSERQHHTRTPRRPQGCYKNRVSSVRVSRSDRRTEAGVPCRAVGVILAMIMMLTGTVGCVLDFATFRPRPADAMPDATVDGSVDTRPSDARTDGTDTDTTVDTGIDARPSDVRTDGPTDGPRDVTDTGRLDAVMEAARDVFVDAPTDREMDAAGTDAMDASDAAVDCAVRLVVNELQSGGRSASDEFVEVYNASDCEVSLVGWTLRYSSAGGSTPTTKWTGGPGDRIGPHGFVVIGGSGFMGSAIGVFAGGSALAGTGGAIGLFTPAGVRVDSVGYGPAVGALVEGMPASAPEAGQSIGRVPDGIDTDDNQRDFRSMTTPTPNAPNR